MPQFAPLIDTVPDELKARSARTAFLVYVKGLPVSRAVKRRLIVQWARLVGDVLTADLFDQAGVNRGTPADRDGKKFMGKTFLEFVRDVGGRNPIGTA